jgi:hypothetical protein
MPRSQKPQVIERIFERLLDASTGRPTRSIVTNQDVTEAIAWCNKHKGTNLSDKNPANFIKDIIRGAGASGMWPQSLHERKIGARQVTGDGNVFEFVPYEEGQKEPFPQLFAYHSGVHEHELRSVSMPLASKALGRNDETYLIQVAIKLGLVETHFALFSDLNVVELNHLQIGIKLRLTEVDSMYAATYLDDGGESKQLVITVEAKKRGQRILADQIVRQVKAAFNETPNTVGLVVPLALVSAGGGIYVAEFVPVRRSDSAKLESLILGKEVLYKLKPPVKGI